MRSTIIPAILFFIGIVFCSVVSAQTGSAELQRWRPVDFKPDSGILLIEKPWIKKEQKRIEEFLQQNYPYKYEIATFKEINNDPKYADKQTYRFVLLSIVSAKEGIRTWEQQSPGMTPTYEYDFTDRLEGRDYFHTGTASRVQSASLIRVIKKILKGE